MLPPNTLLTLHKVEGPPFRAEFRRWIRVRTLDGEVTIHDRRRKAYYLRVREDGKVCARMRVCARKGVRVCFVDVRAFVGWCGVLRCVCRVGTCG